MPIAIYNYVEALEGLVGGYSTSVEILFNGYFVVNDDVFNTGVFECGMSAPRRNMYRIQSLQMT